MTNQSLNCSNQENQSDKRKILPALQTISFQKEKMKQVPLKITLIYLMIGAGWIFLSDRFLELMIMNKDMITPMQTYKGWFYVLTTSCLLYFFSVGYVRLILQSTDKMEKACLDLELVTENLETSEKRLREKNRELEESLLSLKHSEEKILRLAYYDTFTNTPNRTLFHKTIKQEIISAETGMKRFALMFMDLDNFKSVNDTQGHFFGDQLLTEIAGRIKEVLPKEVPLYRFGGDEFIVLYPGMENRDQAAKVAENIFSVFKDPWVVEEREFYLTISMGITIYPDDGREEENLLKNADNVLHQVKQMGKNKYMFYSEEMEEKLCQKVDLEHKLRTAIEKDELLINYQPIIDTSSEKIIAMEALVRWNHPEKGLLVPEAFISTAEETGLIVQIDHLVIKSVCQQLMEWKEKGFHTYPVSINLSARQFYNADFLQKLKLCMEKSSVLPDSIEFEITESTAMYDLDAALHILSEIKKMGFRISLDDFGTGYSSLNYLRLLPISALKIDKTFIGEIVENGEKKIITETILTLARKMNLDVIAEGVETNEQLTFLKEHQCPRVQGYLFSRPLTAKEMEESFLKPMSV